MSTHTEVPVSLAMSRPVVVLDVDTTLRTAAIVMRDNQLSAIPLGGQRGLSGIVSERDVVRALAAGVDPDETRVGDVTTLEPLSVGPCTPLRAAVNLMHEVGIRHIPVSDHGQVVGMLSMVDALAAPSALALTMSDPGERVALVG